MLAHCRHGNRTISRCQKGQYPCVHIKSHNARERVTWYYCGRGRTSELNTLSCPQWCGCWNGYHAQSWFCKETAVGGPSMWEKIMIHSHFKAIKQNNIPKWKKFPFYSFHQFWISHKWNHTTVWFLTFLSRVQHVAKVLNSTS